MTEIEFGPNGFEMKLPNIIALDPGGTTGYFWRGPDRKHVFGHVRETDKLNRLIGHHLELWSLLKNCLNQSLKNDPEAKLYIVCEEFLYLKTEVEKREKIDYTAKEYIGVAKLFAATYPQHVFIRTYSSSTGKAFWTDEKLKAIGMYSSLSKHARDATRHYLYYVTFSLRDDRYLHLLKPLTDSVE